MLKKKKNFFKNVFFNFIFKMFIVKVGLWFCGFFQAVLRSNQGAVDTTIDQLLTMSTDNENEKIRSEIELSEDGPQTSEQSNPEPISQALQA